MIHDSAYDADLYRQKLTIEKDNEMIEKMKEAGIEVIEIDRAPFKAMAEKVYSQFPEWSDGLYEKIQAELKN